jgi:hypothetical protein
LLGFIYFPETAAQPEGGDSVSFGPLWI